MTTRMGRAVLETAHLPLIERFVTENRAGRAIAERFVAGDHLDDAVQVAVELNASGAAVSLDHLGEHVTDVVAAKSALDDYLACLDAIEQDGLDANVSIKLTQLGLGLDRSLVEESLDALATRAAEVGTTVTIDMEESLHTGDTIEIYSTAQQRHGNLGVAVQAYLYRTPADVATIAPLGGHIRLCKGAYRERKSIALQGRAAVNRAFDALAEQLFAQEAALPAVASHDTERLDVVRGLAADRPLEFQMLYGVRQDVQAELIAAGYRLRIYVPYGAAWYPYLTRRLAERPANIWFFIRALLGR